MVLFEVLSQHLFGGIRGLLRRTPSRDRLSQVRELKQEFVSYETKVLPILQRLSMAADREV